jgi:hypothetical protein
VGEGDRDNGMENGSGPEQQFARFIFQQADTGLEILARGIETLFGAAIFG